MAAVWSSNADGSTWRLGEENQCFEVFCQDKNRPQPEALPPLQVERTQMRRAGWSWLAISKTIQLVLTAVLREQLLESQIRRWG